MGEIQVRIVDLFDYDADYSDAYLDGLMAKAAAAWAEIGDADQWLNEIRGDLDG